MPPLFLKVRARQAGSAAVEFALIVIVFAILVFGTLELARVEYLANTLMEVTRRAAASAANVDFRDTATLRAIQANAVFRNSAGALVLGTPVTSDNVKIDYLSISKSSLELTHMTSLPSCPARNHWNCMTDSQGESCIRFVRARVCASMSSTGACQPMSYQKLLPFLNLSGWHIPVAETIVPAGSLGYSVGSLPCS